MTKDNKQTALDDNFKKMQAEMQAKKNAALKQANDTPSSDNSNNINAPIPEDKDIIKHIKISDLIESPVEWNFFSPLNQKKLTELVESIRESGIISPIIVWETDDNKYMILAGHNRVRSYKILLEQTCDDKYLTIPSVVKQRNEINEDEARAIIVDTNFVCRQLTTLEKAKSILVKYKELGSRKRNDVNIAAAIANQFDLKERQIYRYYQLNRLIPEFINRVDNGSLSMIAALKLTMLPTETQILLWNEYGNNLDNKSITKINTKDTDTDIIATIDKNLHHKYEKIVLNVPTQYADAIKTLVNDFLMDKHA